MTERNTLTFIDEMRQEIAEKDKRIKRLEQLLGRVSDRLAGELGIEGNESHTTNRDKRIQTLEQTARDHEEDCACLPEDRSVTETVQQLQRRIADLEAKLAKADPGDGEQKPDLCPLCHGPREVDSREQHDNSPNRRAGGRNRLFYI